ncbi:unnamed protein product, partial [Rotaria sordida]
CHSNQHEINSNNDNTFEILLNRKHTDISEYDNTIIALNYFVEGIERIMEFIL